MKAFILSLLWLVGISCTNDTLVQPTKPTTNTQPQQTYVYASDSDSLVVKMKEVLIGHWDVLSTQCTFPVPAGGQLFAISGVVDCSKERQWDYVQSLSITSYDTHLLKVQNTYYCTTPRVTYFEFIKEKANYRSNRLFINEKDENGYMIKIYYVSITADPTFLYLDARIYDFSYFRIGNVGSIPAAPFNYYIQIKKRA